MGYTTYFDGQIDIVPALNEQEVAFLTKFAETRRMKRTKGPYFVDGTGFSGQDREDDVIEGNHPPEGQPTLWCQWVPSEDGDAMVWDEGEKFNESPEWMVYLIQHFLGTNPLAKGELDFLQGHTLNGTITAQGEEPDDMWLLYVKDNIVSVEMLVTKPSGEITIIGGETKLIGNDG